MKQFFYTGVLLLFFTSNAFTQKLEGIWEGKLAFNTGKEKTMSVRLELMQDGEALAGVLNMRGYGQGSSFGSDYIVKRRSTGKNIILEQIKVVRAVAMGKEDCAQMDKLDLSFTSKDSVAVLKGFFVWLGGAADKISFKKNDTVISASGEEDMNAYMEERATIFDLTQSFLSPSERFNRKIIDMAVDSGDITLEFATLDSVNLHDSISVYFNEEILSEKYSLSKPLLIRLKDLPDRMNTVVVVNESIVKRNLRVDVIVRNGELKTTRTIEPGYSRNSLFVFRRQQ